MKIGIGSGAYWSGENLPHSLALMKEHGFGYTDYQPFTDTENNPLFECSDDEFELLVKKDSDALAAAGITVSQTHGPWRYPPRDATAEDRQERFEKMSRALHGTKLLGCKYMVIHPLMPFGTADDGDIDEYFRINREFFRSLIEVAEKEDVVICFENMPMPKLPLATTAQILDFVKEMNSPYFKVCLDTGHAAVCGESVGDAVRMLGDYLKVMHVHDNNGHADQHLLPYSGVIDWADFGKALKEINFDGVLSLECSVGKNLPDSIKDYHRKGLYMIAEEILK